MKYASMADRLIANSVLSPDHTYDGTPCWEWMRRLNNQGYPTLTRRLKRGPRKGQVVTVFAHRESIIVFNRAAHDPAYGGAPPEGRHRTPFRTEVG